MKDESGPLLSVDLWNGKGKERKVAGPGIKPRASGFSHQHSVIELQQGGAVGGCRSSVARVCKQSKHYNRLWYKMEVTIVEGVIGYK